jgi:hypothetical protein
VGCAINVNTPLTTGAHLQRHHRHRKQQTAWVPMNPRRCSAEAEMILLAVDAVLIDQ